MHSFISVVFVDSVAPSMSSVANRKRYIYEVRDCKDLKIGDILSRHYVQNVKQDLVEPYKLTYGTETKIPEDEDYIYIENIWRDVDIGKMPTEMSHIAATGAWRIITSWTKVGRNTDCIPKDTEEMKTLGDVFTKLESGVAYGPNGEKLFAINKDVAMTVSSEEELEEWRKALEPPLIRFVNGRLFEVNTNENSKEENNMNMMKIMGNVLFGKYDNSTIKYSFNGIAFLGADGTYNVYEKDGSLTNVSDLVMDIPVFAMPVSKAKIAVGDVILSPDGNKPLVVKEINDVTIVAVEPYTTEIKTFAPRKSIFGFDFYTKIVTPMDMFGGTTANADNPFGNMLPFLMFGDGKFDDNSMLMLAMMGGGTAFEGNNMLPFLLMNKGGDNDFLSTFMLMNAFNQNK
jgi:hypothetical protein